MKTLISFILGVILTLFACYGSYKQPPKVITKTEWRTKVINLPSKVDTFYVPVTKYRTIYKTKVIKDTIKIVKVDTVFVENKRVVDTRFSFRPREFIMFANCYAPVKVDSMKFHYKMRQSYIDEIRRSKEYPAWKKGAFFIGGALFTGTLFYLVK